MDSIQHSFIPVIALGLKDSLSLYSVLNVFIFVHLLLIFGKNLKQIYIFGLTYFLIGIYFYWLILVGAWDEYIFSQYFPKVSDCLNLFWIVISLSFGILNIFDWSLLRSSGETNKCVICFTALFSEYKKHKFAYLYVSNICSLFALSVCSIVLLWASEPKHYYLTLLYSLFASKLDLVFAGQSYFLYGIFVFMPVLLVWIGYIYLVKFWKNIKHSANVVRYLKAGLSSVGVALSLGLLYIKFLAF